MKSNDLVIDNFQTGIADSDFQGFADMRNLDPFTIPGAIQINWATAKQSSTTITGKPYWFAYDSVNQIMYCIDSDGKVYKSTTPFSSWSIVTGNGTATPDNNGLAIWKDYLFAPRGTVLDIYGPLSTSITATITIASPGVVTSVAHGLSTSDGVIFSTSGALPTGLTAGTTYYVESVLSADTFRIAATIGGAAINTSGSQSGTQSYKFWKVSWGAGSLAFAGRHPALVGQDDILYVGAGNKLASVAEVATKTFSPTDATTYTFTQAALTLPTNFKISCLAELGVNLMVGTFKGAVSYAGSKVANIFPWDRSSTTFRLPIQVNEFGINKMVTINNVLYFTAGTNGAIYATNGSSTTLLRELYKPMQHSSLQQATYGPVQVDGSAEFVAHSIMAHKNRLFIAASGAGNSYIGPQGVWSMDLQTRALTFEQQLSTGNVVPSTTVHIGCLFSISSDSYLIGWYDAVAGAQGIDLVSTASRYTSYAAYFDSPMYEVGNHLHPRTFTQIEFQLAAPLTTGQGVRLSYRKTTDAVFTAIGTYDFATNGAIRSYNAPAPITDTQTIQIRCEVTTGASSKTTPILKYVSLR